MNHNLVEMKQDRVDGQPEGESNQWQAILQEANGGYAAEDSAPNIQMESNEELESDEARLIKRIQEIKQEIQEQFGITSGEKLVEMTDEALVYIAKETIAAADEDGIRTEDESADVKEAMSTVIMQGAMEEAGIEHSSGGNPIIELNRGETKPDLDASVEAMRVDGAKLPDGENIAELADRIIEKDVSGSESNEHEPRKSASEIIRTLSEREIERTAETAAYPRAEIICDRNHIEGQKIDVINKSDRGVMEFRFKLRESTEAMDAFKLGANQNETILPNGMAIKRGAIKYEDISSGQVFTLCDAKVIEKDGAKISIALPGNRNGNSFEIVGDHNWNKKVRTALGLVTVEISSDKNPEDIEKALGDILKNDLGIPDALNEVPEAAEREYKLARYKWIHKIEDEPTPEQIRQAEALSHEEVFPGYTTYIEKGKHREYLEKYGDDVRITHFLGATSPEAIFSVLTRGLMCSTERYSRGFLGNGMSTGKDMDTGGGDSVFTRVTDARRRNGIDRNSTMVIFKPEIFDRTDWYAYGDDTYGSTDPHEFVDRLSPEEVIEKSIGETFRGLNEQMFRTGIGPDYIESIQVAYRDRGQIIDELRAMGLEQVGGKPIEEMITAVTPPPEELNPVVSVVEEEPPIVVEPKDTWAKSDEEIAERQEEERREMIRKSREDVQAIVEGASYGSAENVFDIAGCADDPIAALKTMIDAVIARGQKEELAKDMTAYLKDGIELEYLEMLKDDKSIVDDDVTEDEYLTIMTVKNALNLDFNAMYEKKMAEEEAKKAPKPSEELPNWPGQPEEWSLEAGEK